MSSYPKISIVTPNYNCGRYLEDTIVSVISQNYPNLEYIIIDGGSTDNSVEVIEKYASYLTYWESSPDNGIYDAIQKGLSRTTGEIMAWLNSDDMYHRKSLFIVAEIFANNKDIQWLTAPGTLYDEKGRTVSVAGDGQLFSIYDHYLGIAGIQQESTFWRRDLWNRAGAVLNTGYKVAGDYDLWTRFFQYEKLYLVNALLGGFRVRTMNQASLDNKELYYREMSEILGNYELSAEVRRNFQRITKYTRYREFIRRNLLFRTFNKHAIINKIDCRIERVKDYPPRLVFDRASQKFIKQEDQLQ